MKSLNEAREYFGTLKTWNDGNGDCADPGPRHAELYDFKGTVNLAADAARFEGSTLPGVLGSDGSLGDWATWTMTFDGIGTAHLHLYDLSSPDDAHTWAELWIDGEPWWNGDDPYECSWAQIGQLLAALPQAEREAYLDLAAARPSLAAALSEHGIGASIKP